MAPRDTLAGLHIVITRPAHQAGNIRRQLLDAGAHPIAFPTIAITSPSHPDRAQQRLQQITDYDLIIFISANAVHHALLLMTARDKQCLQQARIGAIGSKTAHALHQHQLPVTLQPGQHFTSEAFLALNAVQVLNDTTVLIIRGEGGRETLATTLTQRGAQVDYADVYQRIIPACDPHLLKQQHRQQQLDIIAITSSESLRNLLQMTGNPAWLKTVPLLAGSQRIADYAYKNGFDRLIVADDPSDEAMLQALRHRSAKGQPKDNNSND